MTPPERAPVQATRVFGVLVKPLGTIAWSEHVEAWQAYDARYHSRQSAERIAERYGFDWAELCTFLGHEPTTWRPR